MDDNKPISMEDVAGKIVEIAKKVPNIVGEAIQTGYQEAVKAYCGFCGEVTIKKESWIYPNDESLKVEVQIVLPDVRENDMIIFSPKTAEDRRRINYAELFISPIISTVEIDEEPTEESKKFGLIDVSCEREPPTDKITLIYSVMRIFKAFVQDTTANNPGVGEDVEDPGDQAGSEDGSGENGGMVEIPIEED